MQMTEQDEQPSRHDLIENPILQNWSKMDRKVGAVTENIRREQEDNKDDRTKPLPEDRF